VCILFRLAQGEYILDEVLAMSLAKSPLGNEDTSMEPTPPLRKELGSSMPGGAQHTAARVHPHILTALMPVSSPHVVPYSGDDASSTAATSSPHGAADPSIADANHKVR
jgi:hypothetical protein